MSSNAANGKIGGLVTHARYGSDAIAARAREGFLARFEREVDPDHKLLPEERRKRAEYARKAHMARLSLASAKARASKRNARQSEALTAADSQHWDSSCFGGLPDA